MKYSCCRSEHKFEQGFPQTYKVGWGEGVVRRSYEAGFKLKLFSATWNDFETKPLILSSFSDNNARRISCDSVSLYIWTSGEILNKIT